MVDEGTYDIAIIGLEFTTAEGTAGILLAKTPLGCRQTVSMIHRIIVAEISHISW